MAILPVEFLKDGDGVDSAIVPVPATESVQGGIKAATTTDNTYCMPFGVRSDGKLYIPIDMNLSAENEAANAKSTREAFSYNKYTVVGDDLAANAWLTDHSYYGANGQLTSGDNYVFARLTLEKGAYYVITNQTEHKSVVANARFFKVVNGVYTQIWVSSKLDICFRCPWGDENADYVMQLAFHIYAGGERPILHKVTPTSTLLSEYIHTFENNGGRTPEAYNPNGIECYLGANKLTCTREGIYRGIAGTLTEGAYDSGEVEMEPGVIYKIYNPDKRQIRIFKVLSSSDYRCITQCNNTEFYAERPDDRDLTQKYVLGFTWTQGSDKVKPTCHPIVMSDSAKILMDKIRDAEGQGSRPLRVLAFGGHNTIDQLSYVPMMAEKYGVKIDLTIFYRTSMTLQQLLNEWDTTASHNIYQYANMMGDGIGKWSANTSYFTAWTSPEEVIRNYGPFDLIIFNQDRVQAPTMSSFTSYWPQIDVKLRSAINYKCKLGYLISPNYQTKITKNADVLANAKTFTESYMFDVIIPGGTAWMNACTVGDLAACGGSTYGKMWYTDNSSLDEGIGCYIGACTCLEAIFRTFYPHLSVNGDPTRLTYADLTTYNIPGKQSTSEAVFNAGMTEQNHHLAWRAAILANNHPFEIKEIY